MDKNVNKSEFFSRTALLLGDEAQEKLTAARVALFGVGGVGGYALEALVRAGVGTIHVIDADTVSESNLNRQILATCDTVGAVKVQAAKERAQSINPFASSNSLIINSWPSSWARQPAKEVIT